MTRLRERREAAGLSQVALADAMRNAGMDHWRQTTVSRVERGTQGVKPWESAALDKILGATTSDAARIEATLADVRTTGANAIARMDAAEEAADMLVHWFRSGIALHPNDFRAVLEAVEGWEAAR